MWADGTLERFDEMAVIGIHPDMAKHRDIENRLVQPQRYAGRGTLEDFYTYVEESLRAYEGYFIPKEQGDDYVGYMPYAFLLEKGLRLFNPDTHARYTIDEVINPSKCEVRLSEDSDAPAITDNLEFDRDKGLIFTRAQPRDSAGVDFESDATRKDTPTAPAAYIDFAVVEERIAESDPHSARPTKFKAPMFRETIESTEPTIAHEIYGQWLDARVRFDLWAQTSDYAEKLVYWFYRYMRFNGWIFKFNGIPVVQFERRGIDQPVGKWRQNMYHRPLDYHIRTEHLFTRQIRKLDHIALYVNLKQSRVMETYNAPKTGRPTYDGDSVPVTVTFNET